MLAEGLADATRRIDDGEKARIERDRLILKAREREWKQEKIAEAAGMTQQGVSKRLSYLAKHPPPPEDATTTE